MITNIRNSILPNHLKIPNVGSFFKNPLVSEKFFQNNKKLEKLKTFKREGDQIKLSAAEMIDKSDLKGMRLNNLGISSNSQISSLSNDLDDDDKDYVNFLKKKIDPLLVAKAENHQELIIQSDKQSEINLSLIHI